MGKGSLFVSTRITVTECKSPLFVKHQTEKTTEKFVTVVPWFKYCNDIKYNNGVFALTWLELNKIDPTPHLLSHLEVRRDAGQPADLDIPANIIVLKTATRCH
jgi:hypothetical protein